MFFILDVISWIDWVLLLFSYWINFFFLNMVNFFICIVFGLVFFKLFVFFVFWEGLLMLILGRDRFFFLFKSIEIILYVCILLIILYIFWLFWLVFRIFLIGVILKGLIILSNFLVVLLCVIKIGIFVWVCLFWFKVLNNKLRLFFVNFLFIIISERCEVICFFGMMMEVFFNVFISVLVVIV